MFPYYARVGCFPQINLPLIHSTMFCAEVYNSVLKLWWHWSCTIRSHTYLVCLKSFLLQTQPLIFWQPDMSYLHSQHYWVISVCHFWQHIQYSLVISCPQVIPDIHSFSHDSWCPQSFQTFQLLVFGWAWNELWVVQIWCDWCVSALNYHLGLEIYPLSWNDALMNEALELACLSELESFAEHCSCSCSLPCLTLHCTIILVAKYQPFPLHDVH